MAEFTQEKKLNIIDDIPERKDWVHFGTSNCNMILTEVTLREKSLILGRVNVARGDPEGQGIKKLISQLRELHTKESSEERIHGGDDMIDEKNQTLLIVINSYNDLKWNFRGELFVHWKETSVSLNYPGRYSLGSLAVKWSKLLVDGKYMFLLEFCQGANAG